MKAMSDEEMKILEDELRDVEELRGHIKKMVADGKLAIIGEELIKNIDELFAPFQFALWKMKKGMDSNDA